MLIFKSSLHVVQTDRQGGRGSTSTAVGKIWMPFFVIRQMSDVND